MVKAVQCIRQSESKSDNHNSGIENVDRMTNELLIDSSQSSDESDSDHDEEQYEEESHKSTASSTDQYDENHEIILPESLDNITVHRLSCLAHTLQSVLKSIDQTGSFKNVLCKARKLLKMFEVSSVATEKLMKKTSLTLVTDSAGLGGTRVT